MDQSLKKKWVEALLSGKYKQGDGALYDSWDRTYCCLGVLRSCAKRGDTRARGFEELLNDEQLSEVGLTHAVQKKLATLNDRGVPFDMIAGLIDEAL